MTGSVVLPPAFALFIGAAVLPVARGKLRSVILLAAPLAALALVWTTPDGNAWTGSWIGYDVALLRGDRLARWFGTIFALIAFAGGLFALRQTSRLEVTATQAYAGAALGVVFAGDVLTLFVFWEIMALASAAVIWSAGPAAREAGLRYLGVHLFGGVLLMIGLGGEVYSEGTTVFSAMSPNTPARWLILAGFLINAGAPPLSAWLPDAYPRASFSGMVMLSAFTTKAAVFVLLRGFPGAEVLIWIGLFMVFYGIVYAILENDMRRILAYSIVNQVGFMVTGIGIGTGLALDGAASHAFTHIIYKALLLMAAGSVLYATGRSKCTELGGLFRSMPLTTACGVVGALAISAFPLTSGFVTKSMISDAAGTQGLVAVWYLLAAASAGVFLHAGIKFPWFVFFQRDSGLRPPDPPWNMRAAMLLLAVLCVLLGCMPSLLYEHLPFGSVYQPYDGSHVVSQLQLLLFSGLAFFILLDALRRTPTITLDTDWVYRHLGTRLWHAASAWVATIWSLAVIAVRALAVQALIETRALARDGWLSGAQASSTMAMLAVVMLAVYLAVTLIV
jgi:multicomponent Na+:H+ antiporter subunit D